MYYIEGPCGGSPAVDRAFMMVARARNCFRESSRTCWEEEEAEEEEEVNGGDKMEGRGGGGGGKGRR